MIWIDEAINKYITFLRENISVHEVDNGWYSITTPFLNMFNDYIDIYCCKKENKIYLSDDGETIRNLNSVGVSFSRSKTRKQILNQILLNYNIKISNQNDELIVETDMNGFAQAKNNLLSAIMEISDMYMTSKTTTVSVFKDEVRNYLDEQQIIYTPEFIARGSTGLEFNFAFQIAGRKKEILINAFNIINKNNLTFFLFDWNDVKDARQRLSNKKITGLAIINDREKNIDGKYLDALTAKGTDFILFSKRNLPESRMKLDANAA